MKHKKSDAKIEVTKDGPYLVSGDLPLSEQSIVTNAGANLSITGKERNTPRRSNMRFAAAASRPTNPFAMARTRRFSSTAPKRPAISLI
jgi:hypothetical protein